MPEKQKPMTKTALVKAIGEKTECSKAEVEAFLNALTECIEADLNNAGAFVLPGLLKVEEKIVPARPAQKNVKNPFTGEFRDLPAKPESKKVKIKALKNLKAMVL